MEKNLINTFYLSDPALWANNKAVLTKYFLKVLNDCNTTAKPSNFSKIDDFVFEIDSFSGHLTMSIYYDMWRPVAKGSVVTLQEAEVIAKAKSFIKKLQDSADDKEFKEKEMPPILPSTIADVQLVDTVLVPHYDRPWIDHWLCRFMLVVSPTKQAITEIHEDGDTHVLLSKDKVPVVGCQVDIRIGNNGDIVGFQSSWRPSFLKNKPLEYVEYNQETMEVASHGHSNTDSHTKPDDAHELPQLVYVLDGASNPQNRLLPYYLHQEGHDSYFAPASSGSLMLKLYQEPAANGEVKLTGWAEGGSGDYIYQWSRFSPDNIDTEGVIVAQNFVTTAYNEKTKQPTISELIIPEGVHNIILLAADRQTNIIKQKQFTVYTSLVNQQNTLNA